MPEGSTPPSFPPVHYPPGDSLHAMLERAADRHGEALAMRFFDEVITYRELDGFSNGFAHLLAARGVALGDRVALMASNRPEFFMAVYGAMKLGASVVLVSPSWKQGEISHGLGLTDPSVIVCDGDTHQRLPDGHDADVIHLDNDAVLNALQAGSGERIAVDADWSNTEAALVFSSGTTGLPKAVRHTHRSTCAATIHWASALGLGPNDRFQIATPPFHILGLLNMWASVLAGSSVRLHPRFDLDEVLRRVETDRITIEIAVAPIALAMANHPDLERYDLSSLRYIMWGATPVTESVARRVTERTGIGWLPAYGASEAPVLTSNRVTRPDTWRLDTPGVPLHDVRIRIVDIESGAVRDEPGAPGEIQVKAPTVMAGYLPEEANEEAFVDGWYRTGDIGWVEPEGWLHITDRLKEMVKVKGFQVAPAEVEAILHGHDDVTDCAVFGVPDAETGEAVVAAVALAETATVTADELRDLVARSLASYKCPRDVLVVDEIPRNPSGKVLRRLLREQ